MTILVFVFALGILALLVFGLVSTAGQQGKKVDTLKRGVESQGTITALERDRHSWHYCYPVVRFRTTGGEWVTLRARTSILRENLKVGQ